MSYSRLPLKDPRTVSREIPGIFDILFPQLTRGIVSYFNKRGISYDEINSLPESLLESSTLNHPMLFEVAYSRAEELLLGKKSEGDWSKCIKIATERQQRHFDAVIPDSITTEDVAVAELVANNLYYMLNKTKMDTGEHDLMLSPEIPGYQWISSGVGDFSVGANLIEVKCSGRNFGSSDYRQILMYWLLSYASSIENDLPEWETGILINPRRNCVVRIEFDEIIEITSAGKSKVEVLELFASVVGDYALKALSEFKL